MNKTKTTLTTLSIRECVGVQAEALIAYLGTIKVDGFHEIRESPSVVIGRNTARGQEIERFFAVFDKLGIERDVGFCSGGSVYCHSLPDGSGPDDGTLGLRYKAQCGSCNKFVEEIHCDNCFRERQCVTCLNAGVRSYICRDCQPDSLDGIAWPYVCEGDVSLCNRCVVTHKDCSCVQCSVGTCIDCKTHTCGLQSGESIIEETVQGTATSSMPPPNATITSTKLAPPNPTRTSASWRMAPFTEKKTAPTGAASAATQKASLTTRSVPAPKSGKSSLLKQLMSGLTFWSSRK